VTMTKTRLGTNEDGTPLYHYASDGHVVMTGPINGSVTVPDGTEYDVTEQFIEVASLEHAGHVSHAIGVRHEDEGHPAHQPTLADPNPVPFVHVCTDHCGAAMRSADETVARFEARTDTSHPDHAARVAVIRANHATPQEG